MLWKLLKSSQLQGRKFRRQHSIGNYIVDFYCPEEKLVTELDGKHQFGTVCSSNDDDRGAQLHALAIRVIRIENRWVFSDPERILQEIRNSCQP